MFRFPFRYYAGHVAALYAGVGGGGSGEWTPSELSATLLAWHKGDELTGNDEDNVATWEDAANANDLTAPGTNGTLAAADLNGLNTLRFQSARYVYSGNIFSAASAASAYLILKIANDPPGATIDSGLWNIGSHGGTDHWPWTDGNIYDGFCSSVRKSAGNPSVSLASDYRIIGVHSASNDYGIHIDGVSHFSTGTNTFGVSGSTLTIGSNAALDAFLDGWIAEILFIDSKLSDANRQNVEGYLAHKWGLTGNLDAGHPYKTDPPTI